MKIGGINGIPPELQKMGEVKKKNDSGFGDMMMDFVKGVNDASQKSKAVTQEFIQGGDVELHEVMIAGQKAKTSLDLLMEIRNKSIDMYKELTRMQ